MSNAPAVHEAASLPRRPPAARKPRGLWLWLAAIGVALTLCGSETVSGGRKNVFNPDHYTQLTHVVSVADAIAEGQIPPRVSPFLSRGLGNPYHQFYPPFSHAAPAALGALAGDAMAGYAAAAVLFTALCFVYSWKLSRLLTLSDASAAAGAFLFTAAPYLLFDRISRSAWPEYAAFSMLPLVLYLLLRWAAAGGLWRLLAASAALACLFATHLVTSFLFACFLAAFAALWSLNSLRLRGAEGRVIRGKIAGRVLRALAAGAFGALIAACYLGPAALYGDLYMKRVHLPASPFGDSRFFVPLLALLSASDSRLVETDMVASLRIQMGTALLLSCLAYAWSLLRPPPPARWRRPLHAPPLILAAALALAATMAPEQAASLFPPLKVTQFSFRILVFFVIPASLMGAMGLRAFWPGSAGTGASRRAAALALCLLAIVLAPPYLYQAELMPYYPATVTEAGLREQGFLAYGTAAYLRPPPGPAPPELAAAGLRTVPGEGGSARKLFTADLSSAPRLPDGGVPLEVFHYPGLQEIAVRVDGREIPFRAGTFWQQREGLADIGGSSFGSLDGPGPGPFHGLALSGLPESGLLEAEVRFTGMRSANIASAAALSAFAALCLFACLPRGRGLPRPGRAPCPPPAARRQDMAFRRWFRL